jgi:hypothetical protein
MFHGSTSVPSSTVKLSFLLEHLDLKEGTNMLSQNTSDEPTCAAQQTKKSKTLTVP